MGLWCFFILFIGIALLLVGFKNKDVSRSEKIVILSFILGSILVLIALILFMPGSSYVLDKLLNIKN